MIRQQSKYRLTESVTVSEWHFRPSPARNHPLKSMANTSFAAAPSTSGVRCLIRRRPLNPLRARVAAIVLSAGHARSGPRQLRSFFGHHVGCPRRASTTAASILPMTRVGECSGAELRSS